MLIFVQVLRAVAATMVVWHHARHEVDLLAARGAGSALAPDTLLPWWAGVDLFFVISGLVIVHAGLPLAGRPGGRRLFLAHRIARVVPLYWLTSLLYLLLTLVAPSMLGEAGILGRNPPYVAASFLFWPMARPDGSVQPLYGLGWTLNYEMAFYAVFALCLGFGPKRAVPMLWALLATLTTAGALASLPLPLAFWADPIIVEFALGAGLGLARLGGWRLSGRMRLSLAFGGVAGLLLTARHLGGAGEISGFTRPLLVGGPALLLVAAAALGPGIRQNSLAARPRFVRVLVYLGDASYALYLVHPFALRAGREAVARTGLAAAVHPWGTLLILAALALVAAVLVHGLVERPVTRALRRWIDGRENRGVAGFHPVPTDGRDR